LSEPVGADIESICGKCGDVWHVVVAKVGDTIARVICKQCGREHRHKPPGGTAQGKPAAGAARGAPARKSRAKAAPEPDTPKVTFDPNKPPRPYRPTEHFDPGDRVAHPTFGVGIVEGSPGPGKIDVLFPSGRKVLAQAKEDLRLERPRGGGAEGASGEGPV
jgi:hypothetical protein